MGCQQRRQLLVREPPELEPEHRSPAPDAVRHPAHPLRRRDLVRAIGRECEHPLVGEVVGEKDEEVERGGVGPVQVLEHEKHGDEGRSVGEHHEGLLEDPQLGALHALGGLPQLPERTQSLDVWLVGQLRTDEIDCPAEEDLEPGGTRTLRELGRERALPDARFSGNEDRRTGPRMRRVERVAELPELADASDEHVARTHPVPGRYGAWLRKIRHFARCAPADRRRRSPSFSE